MSNEHTRRPKPGLGRARSEPPQQRGAEAPAPPKGQPQRTSVVHDRPDARVANDRDRRSLPEDPKSFASTRFEQASALDLVDGRERDSALDFVSTRDDSEPELAEGRAAERELISAREQAALRGLVPEREAKRGGRNTTSDRARGPAAGSRESEQERAFREQQAAREAILNKGQNWAREQAVARAKALRDQPREPKPSAKGGLVEERAARTRADPRRDPTHPQQPPLHAPPERGARRPDEVIRPPREVFSREGRAPANANEPVKRVSIQPARAMRESMPGSGPPRAAAREVRANAVAEDARSADAARSGPPGASQLEGRKFPSQQGASAPNARISAKPEVGRFPSQQGANAPEGRKFPSQQGANAPEGRKFPSQQGASAPEGRRYPSQPGSGARETSNRAAPSSRNPAPPAARSGAPSGSPRPDALYCEIDGLAVEIQLQDLSVGGLFVQTPSPPPVDSEVEVFLQLGSVRIEASGHIVQSLSGDRAKRERRRPGFGLLFTRLDDSARNALRDALDALNSAAAEPSESEYDFSRPPTNPGFSTPAHESPVSRASAQPLRSNQPGARIPAAQRSDRAAAAQPAPAPAAAPLAQGPIDPKELELLAQLKAELVNVESQPPWTVLGISQGADAATARSAFHAASKRYHPHAYARYALPEIKAVVTQLFIVYKRAFATMTKSGRGGRNPRAAVSGNPPNRSSDPGNR